MEIISESEESQASVEPEKKKHTPFFNYIEAKKEKKKAYRHQSEDQTDRDLQLSEDEDEE